MQNGYFDATLLERLEPDFPYLLVNPAAGVIGYAGWQWVAIGQAAEIRAMAREFRAATGKALYATEMWRSIETQEYYFYDRYQKVGYNSGIFYKGAWWAKKPGKDAAAIPGTSIHGNGLAGDFGSGIQEGFGTPEHVAFEAIAKRHGWTNTGRNFGEPWHFEQTGTGTIDPSSGGTITPAEEDDMYNQDDRDRDVQAAKDAAITKGKANLTLQQAQANGEALAAARADLAEVKGLVTRVLALDSNKLDQLTTRAAAAASRAQDVLDILAKK